MGPMKEGLDQAMRGQGAVLSESSGIFVQYFCMVLLHLDNFFDPPFQGTQID